jgi:ribosomal protein L11 methyltransferase
VRELTLRVPSEAVEDVLDRLLPLVAGGVREVPHGCHVELKMRGDALPSVAEVARAAGRWRHSCSESAVPDDWRERRLLDFRPDIIGGRLVVRPDWAPAPGPPLVDLVLTEATAFGSGSHPTTRTCLELLLEVVPLGSFADLGSGTGVLSVLAAKLGWQPVTAVDLQPESIEAIAANAAANEVSVDAHIADLAVEPPPVVDGLAANVPSPLHALISASLIDPLPRIAVLSGFGPREADDVLAPYAARGLRAVRQLERGGWTVALLQQD